MTAPKTPKYDASQIQVLEGLEPVRKRPGMYIGSTDTNGLHHCIQEVVDNSIDEYMAGHCDTVTIVINDDGSLTVKDNGRGIPVDIHAKTGRPAIETVLTTLHAGGKFDGEGYKVSGGLHGVGVSCVNALSTKFIARVWRDGEVHMQEYSIGIPVADLIVERKMKKGESNGTEITFYPDGTIFDTTLFEFDRILTRIRQQAYLSKNISISLEDNRKGKERKKRFFFEGGIKTYVSQLNRNRDKIGDVFYFEAESDEGSLEIALQYNDTFKDHVLPFANFIHTSEGGSHLVGFRTALTRAINTYARSAKILKDKDDNLTGDDVREGLTAIISVKLEDPQFEGQTKSKLGNAPIRGFVESTFVKAFSEFLEENPSTGRGIINKCSLAARARLAARAARDSIIRKGALEGMTLPGKLADCSSRKAEECELYIVEGDSAGGSAKMGRDRRFQAILPLRGKILNTERARLDRILTSNEVKNLVIALGAGIGETFDQSKLRYHRVIVMTDADVDGAHIRTLLLTLFYRYIQPVITHGHLYIAQPPLYSLTKGKKVHYVYTEEEKVAYLKANGEEGFSIQRYKGLGEMNPEQLWETTMNPEGRMMHKVNINDAEKADAIFDTLMGPEVAPRKKFIQTHAKEVTIDV